MTSPREALLADVAELGREFARLGWTRRLPALREYYAAVTAAQERTERWAPELVARLRRVVGLGLGSNVLPTGDAVPALRGAARWLVGRCAHDDAPR